MADASLFDLIAVPKRDALYGSEKARVRLVFPWISRSFFYSYPRSNSKNIYFGAELGRLEAYRPSQAGCLTSVIGAGVPGG